VSANRRIPYLLLLALILLGAAVASSDEIRCSLCGKLIGAAEKYYEVKGSKEVFCETCYEEAPRCSLCNLPSAVSDLDAGTGACSKCLAKLPRCKACGRPIVGTYYSYSSSKGVFCADCRKNRPACAICEVPVGTTYWQYPDGRIICDDCGDRAIFDSATIQGIVRDVQRTLERQLGLKILRPYTVQIQKLSGLSSSDLRREGDVTTANNALYGKELGMYRFAGGKSEICLLYGLPPDLLFEAAAHEYAHAWEIENGLGSLEPELLEGFAQWVAAQVLREKGFHGTLERLEARTDFPYGTGYRRLNALHQNIVKELIRQKK
jgi:hypothetical protein